MDAAQIQSAYAAAFKEKIGVRRYAGTVNRAPRDVPVRGKAASYQAQELIGSIVQGDQKVFVLVSDLGNTGLDLPLTTNDKVVVGGRELAIMSLAERKAPDGTLICYEIQARG